MTHSPSMAPSNGDGQPSYPGAGPSVRRRSASRVRAIAAAAAWGTTSAHASFLSGDALDTAADVLAWVVLVIVPVIGIAVFWIVHVLPEKIAHKNHHPQTKAIQTLCLLSLVFGGLLWPIAWLWAFTRPVTYKLAYGTDKADEYFDEYGAKARAGELSDIELSRFRGELDSMHARGTLAPHLAALRDELAAAPAAGAVAAEAGGSR